MGAALANRAVTQMMDASLPDARGIANFYRPGTITMLASNGQIIQKLGPATREKVKAGQMPKRVERAFIAAEDRRFMTTMALMAGASRAPSSPMSARALSEKERARSLNNWPEPSSSAKTARSRANSRKRL